MSQTLEAVIVSYVENSESAKSYVANSSVYRAEKMLENRVISEIISEHIDEVDLEVKRRERERAAVRNLDEFRRMLFQCVTLALVVGVLSSHVYGLLEALLYQPSSSINLWFLAGGLVFLLVATAVLLYKEYLSKLHSAFMMFVKARKELLNER